MEVSAVVRLLARRPGVPRPSYQRPCHKRVEVALLLEVDEEAALLLVAVLQRK